MSNHESRSEFLTGWAPVAFPGIGFIVGTMTGAYRFDRAEPYEAQVDELSTVNSGLEDAVSVLSTSPESRQTIESLITRNEVKIDSLSTTVDHYHTTSDVPETMLIGTGGGAVAAVLLVGGIKLWAKTHRAKTNIQSL